MTQQNKPQPQKSPSSNQTQQPIKITESFKYQSHYCEENVWQLCQEPCFSNQQTLALFISNPNKTCALWYQRSAEEPNLPIIWDYHVVFLSNPENSPKTWLLWDFDSYLPFPTPTHHYLKMTFCPYQKIPQQFAPTFRLIDGKTYAQTLSSDRSHMQDPKGNFIKTPPPWPHPHPNQPNNLMQFINFQQTFVGEVIDLHQLLHRFPPPSQSTNHIQIQQK